MESGHEAKSFLIDFSAVFDRVNNHGILSQLCSVGIEGTVLSVLTQFLSNRTQYVAVYGGRRKLVKLVSTVPRGIVLGQFLFFLNTSKLFSVLENKLHTLMTPLLDVVVSSSVEIVAVEESMINDVVWWYGVSLIIYRYDTRQDNMILLQVLSPMILFRHTTTMHPKPSPLTLNVTVLKESVDLYILGVTFDAKMGFEMHLHFVSKTASRRLVILKH